MQIVYRVALLLIAVPLLAACGLLGLGQSAAGGVEDTPLVVGESATIRGEVVDIISDCAFDGRCAYIVAADDGQQYTAVWADGMMCVNFDAVVDEAVIGDTVEVFASVADPNTLTICPEGQWYIRKLN